MNTATTIAAPDAVAAPSTAPVVFAVAPVPAPVAAPVPTPIEPPIAAAAPATAPVSGSVAAAAASDASAAADDASGPIRGDVHAFFYLWYGNPQTDGKWLHWNHKILPHWDKNIARNYPSGRYEPPTDFGSTFSPARGLYSSGDAAVLHSHLEPYRDRTPASVHADVQYIVNTYGRHPALYRNPKSGRPLYFVYDSYLSPAAQWAELLQPHGARTVRGTPLDGDFIALVLSAADQDGVLAGGFDGVYTYFAATGFTHYSNPLNWPALRRWCTTHGKRFIPCVGPGYDDTRLRPWNAANTHARDDGRYYDRYWSAAIDSGADAVGITSFNEWGEGTQIESALPYTPPGPTAKPLPNYLPREPDFYVARTGHWADRFRDAQAQAGRASRF